MKLKENNIVAEKENFIDFGRIFRVLLMQSKMIALITLLGLCISVGIYNLSTKNYKITSLLQVSSNQAGGNIGDSAALDFMLGSSSADVNNLVALYKTRTNILKIVDDLNLNIDIDSNDQEFINIDFINLTNDNLALPDEKLELFLSLNPSAKRVDIYDNSNNKLGSVAFGEKGSFDGFDIKILDIEQPQPRLIPVTVKPRENTFKYYKSLINVSSSIRSNSFYRSDGLLNVSLITSDINLGKDIINQANKIFIEENIKGETEKARKAINFINEQIKSISSILSTNKSKLRDFRERNKSINVDLEIESIIQAISEIDTSIYSLDIEIAEALNNYTENNPLFINLNQKKQALINQKDNIEQKIKSLPLAEQKYIDLYRELEISQDLYAELSNRKLSFSIIEASTLGNIRIVDEAYVDRLISPNIVSVFYSFIVFFIIACLIAIYRGFFYLPISNPAELEDNGIYNDIVGVLPINDDKNQKRYSVSIQSTIVNLKAINDTRDKNTILITSSTPSNGKSLTARSIAEEFSKLGSKVLLLDNDLKRGYLHKHYNKKTIHTDEFININNDNIDNYKIDDNLYFIPRISKLSASFQFLYSSAYLKQFNYFKDEFDYVIIDSAPCLGTSDTSILLTYADIVLGLIRHEQNTISEIKQMKSTIEQLGKDFDGFIYNAYERPRGYYGYYGLYGNYNYHYYANNYLYEGNEDEK